MKKLILVMALFATVFMNGLTAEAFPKGQHLWQRIGLGNRSDFWK